jgi:hypothetical protein
LRLLQLDQLLLAVGSPVGRTEEEQHQPVAARKRSPRLLMPELINGAKVRRPPAYGHTD